MKQQSDPLTDHINAFKYDFIKQWFQSLWVTHFSNLMPKKLETVFMHRDNDYAKYIS